MRSIHLVKNGYNEREYFLLKCHAQNGVKAIAAVLAMKNEIEDQYVLFGRHHVAFALLILGGDHMTVLTASQRLYPI
jgi:hypothetical protein